MHLRENRYGVALEMVQRAGVELRKRGTEPLRVEWSKCNDTTYHQNDGIQRVVVELLKLLLMVNSA